MSTWSQFLNVEIVRPCEVLYLYHLHPVVLLRVSCC
jgi:hypothetical protein